METIKNSFLEWLGPIQQHDTLDGVYALDYLVDHEPPQSGIKLHLKIGKPQLLSRIVFTDAASWNIPEIDVCQDSFSHGGFVGTVSELLEKLKKDVEMMKGGYTLHLQQLIDKFLVLIDQILDTNDVETACCQLNIIDPSGLSCVLNDDDHSICQGSSWFRSQSYTRRFKESEDLGLISKTFHPPISDEARVRTAEGVAQLVKKSKNIVCISGAGISVESGIPPFRSRGKYERTDDVLNQDDDVTITWSKFDASRMTLQGFNSDIRIAEEWWEMKHGLLPKVAEAKPNPAHSFFSYLHSQGKLHKVITQNVDSLHQSAGVPSSGVLELHGHMRGFICSDKKTELNPVPRKQGDCSFSISEDEMREADFMRGQRVPLCPLCQEPLRTETVMFGQPLPTDTLEKASQIVSEADLLFVIGSTLVVAPVNSLPDVALRLNIPIVMINLDDTQYDDYTTALIRQPAGKFLGEVRSHLD